MKWACVNLTARGTPQWHCVVICIATVGPLITLTLNVTCTVQLVHIRRTIYPPPKRNRLTNMANGLHCYSVDLSLVFRRLNRKTRILRNPKIEFWVYNDLFVEIRRTPETILLQTFKNFHWKPKFGNFSGLDIINSTNEMNCEIMTKKPVSSDLLWEFFWIQWVR